MAWEHSTLRIYAVDMKYQQEYHCAPAQPKMSITSNAARMWRADNNEGACHYTVVAH